MVWDALEDPLEMGQRVSRFGGIRGVEPGHAQTKSQLGFGGDEAEPAFE